MSADHDRTFIRTFLGVLAILFAITIAIIFTARIIMAVAEPNELSPARKARVDQYTQPVFKVVTDPGKLQKVATQGGGDAGNQPQSPKQVYTQVCASCHDAGIAGAPQLSDAAAWKPRIAKGKETLYDHAINGFNSMPAKGGNADLSDKSVEQAVDYMLEQAGSG